MLRRILLTHRCPEICILAIGWIDGLWRKDMGVQAYRAEYTSDAFCKAIWCTWRALNFVSPRHSSCRA